ncbi:MAG: hypothetical protein A2Y77_11275 [Planctomycetes bacterium RBG_13_62_9]|nr:MAG: hypothetical protein A2Y77_11275 [Planctomycetes bacterium RBG_13_62_9]
MRLTIHGQTTCSHEDQLAGRCKRIRQRLTDSVNRRLGPEASWVQRHVAHCPRCQRRLVALGKVNTALSIIKSQPHRLDLLMRANSAAVRMLNHSLRETQEANDLEQARPEPCLLERCSGYRQAVTNVAACIAILLLSKSGVFSSLDKVRTKGQTVMKQYYTTQAGEDIAREIFGA